jgi:hypothetical protein
LRKYLLLIWVLVNYSQTFAQSTAKLTGKILNEDLEPIASAYIKIQGTKTTALSNESGFYTINVPANQEFTIQVSYLKVSKTKRVGAIEPGKTKGLNIILDATGVLGPVVVRTDPPGSSDITVIKLKPKKLERFANAGGFEQLLKGAVLGISSSGGELSSGYNVRGGNFDENLVYINDIEVYRPFLVRSGQQEGLSIINGDLVDYLEFSAGGFEARYGDKLSSVLDIKYRQPDSFAATVHLSMLGANLHFENKSKNNRFTYLIGSRFRTNQYLLGTLDVQGDYQPSFYDIQGLFKYRFLSNLSLSYLSSFSQNRFLVAPQSRTTSFGNINSALNLYVAFGGQELMQYSTFLNALSLSYQPTENIDLKLNASTYNTSEREHFTVEGAYRLSELENNLGSEDFANVRRTLGFGYFIDNARNDLTANVNAVSFKGKYLKPRSKWHWGVRYVNEQITDRLNEWRYNDSSEYNITTLRDTSDNNTILLDEFLRADLSIASHRIMGYVQNSRRLSYKNNARITAGVRSHYWTYNRENVISPRAQFSLEPNKAYNDSLEEEAHDSLLKGDWILKFATGFYYQPPFYRELRNLNGVLNPNLRAQQSIHFVLGGDLNFKAWNRPFKFTSEVYYKHLDRLVPYVIDNVRIRYLAENSGQGYATGLDARVNGEFIEGIESWFNFSLLHTQERIYYTDETGVEQLSDWLRRPTDQRVNFSILFQDELPQNPSYKMNVGIVFGSRLPFYFDGQNRFNEGFTIPSYRRVDIGFSKVLVDADSERRPNWLAGAESLWMSLEVFNLLQVNNTISYVLVKDFQNNVFGVPNYLTGRRLNLRFILKI